MPSNSLSMYSSFLFIPVTYLSIEPNYSELISFSYLNKLGLAIQDRLSTLICKICEVCLTPDNALEHIKIKHSFPDYLGSMTSVQKELNDICMDNAVSDNMPLLPKGGPDMPHFIGLKMHDAFKCTAEEDCTYICITDNTKKWHSNKCHSKDLPKTWINCKAQQITNRDPYFQVLAPLHLSTSTSFDSLFSEIEQTLPSFISPPSDSHTRDLPTYIITRGIYEHLKDWYSDQKLRQSVVDIYTQPNSDFNNKLKTLCYDYIVEVSSDARGRDFSVLRPFEVYPMLVSISSFFTLILTFYLAIQSRLGLHYLRMILSRSIVCVYQISAMDASGQ